MQTATSVLWMPSMRAEMRLGLVFLGFFLVTQIAGAGGPRFVAGSTYFDTSHQGQPVLWSAGNVTYFTDLGDLSASVKNATGVTTVAAAAAVWNTVPTAAVSITRGGSLAEDVSGSNVTATSNGVSLPSDVQRIATSFPLGIIFDADGAVIDALFGTGASDPDDCIDSGAMSIVDNFATNGTIAHALILINGRCTGTPAQLEQIEFQLIRAFGRVLGLSWSQANDAVLSPIVNPSLQQLEGWPLMRPLDLNCNQLSTQCVPNPLQLRADDTAALSRLYPVTTVNQVFFPAKQLTQPRTISIHGSVFFRRGQGMQGVNVVARPITPGVLQPDDRYPVSAVSGFLYSGNHGNPVTGSSDLAGEALSDFGSGDPLLEGFYDLSGIPLPPGEKLADFRLSLEPINPLYTGSLLVGPYTDGAPSPSGTLPIATIQNLSAGMAVEQDFVIADSAGDLQAGSGGAFTAPAAMAASGEWQGRIPTPGQTAWFALPVLAGRHFTLESQALDDAGNPTEDKFRPVIGAWDASAMEGSPAANTSTAPFNGAAPGVTGLGVDAIANGELLLAFADQRGDGRPDYAYQGRLLYAETVMPQRLPLAGGTIRIVGCGFRPGMVVSIGPQVFASVTSITPTLIQAIAPATASASGSLDLVVYDAVTNGSAVIAAGISYGAASGDTLSITTALPAAGSVGAANPLIVRVFGPDQVTPIAGVPVSFSILQGAASFEGCDSSTCSSTTTSDGYATALVVPGAVGLIKVRASLTNGASLSSEVTGADALAILPVNASIFIAEGAALSWMAQIQIIANHTPLAGTSVTWSGQPGLNVQSGFSSTNALGIASFIFSLGPWAEGVSAPITACITGTISCASILVFVAHPETETLLAIAGEDQQVKTGGNPGAVIIRLVAPNGQPIVGGTIRFVDSVRSWSPSCTRHISCIAGRLISTFSQTIVSDDNGLASFVPSAPTEATYLLTGQAEAGTTAVLPFRISASP